MLAGSVLENSGGCLLPAKPLTPQAGIQSLCHLLAHLNQANLKHLFLFSVSKTAFQGTSTRAIQILICWLFPLPGIPAGSIWWGFPTPLFTLRSWLCSVKSCV